MQESISNSQEMQEDEIDLRELVRTISRYKRKLVFFTLIITFLSIVWVLSKPNIYHSQVVLVPQTTSSSSMGGLGALAGMAGVDIGGGEMTPDGAYQLYLDDYHWMRGFLLQTKLFEKLNAPDTDKNYRFVLGIDTFYYIQKRSLKKPLAELTDDEKEALLFKTYQRIKPLLSISRDKKTSVITIGFSNPDPVLAKVMVEEFLSKASNALRHNELSDMDKKIKYYDEELEKTNDLALKTQLSQQMSALIQKKVLAQASDYYNVKMITAPSVAYEKDKEGPKRGLIVIVALVTSIIIGIFGIFLLEFLRKEEKTAAE
ncbi:MAG: Wzz/FepE/Etk N-terminal domain-containing protein [Sulfuricurvum sp.]|nr:Wzz/FepE/Etk N-terminal domain-containing protein [Sulfuricurvum sp.]